MMTPLNFISSLNNSVVILFDNEAGRLEDLILCEIHEISSPSLAHFVQQVFGRVKVRL